jgi:hypothetical protein
MLKTKIQYRFRFLDINVDTLYPRCIRPFVRLSIVTTTEL